MEALKDKAKAKQYEEELLAAIVKYKYMRFDHCFSNKDIFSRSTAYNYDLDKLDSIKGALQNNRSHGTNYLLQKWIISENPTLQIAAMKLIAEPDDHRRLQQNYNEVTGKDGEGFIIQIVEHGKSKD